MIFLRSLFIENKRKTLCLGAILLIEELKQGCRSMNRATSLFL